MIVSYNSIILKKEQAFIDKPVVAYRGDSDLEIYFSIYDFPYAFSNTVKTNLLDVVEDAMYSQLVIQMPTFRDNVFSPPEEIVDKYVVVRITKEMIDELHEVGDYTFQLRLFNEDMEARYTLPPITNALKVKEPIASEDGTSGIVGMGITGQSRVGADYKSTEVVDIFDKDGKYNPTEWKTGDLISAEKLNKSENAIEVLSKKFKDKGTYVNTVADMKKYNGAEGEIVITRGFYTLDDGGGAKYLLVNNGGVGLDNGINLFALENGLTAKFINEGVIDARQFGAKLDGQTDDTEVLNILFEQLPEADIVVSNGTALITSTLKVEGIWRKDSSGAGWFNKTDSIEFKNSNILYKGPEGKCSIVFYNHYNSIIKGLRISRNSATNFIDMTGCWYSKFTDFDIPNLTLNKTLNDGTPEFVPELLNTKSMLDVVFENGYFYDGCFYANSTGNDDVNKKPIYMNNITFKNVIFKSYKSEYSIYLDGGHFQRLTFEKCDISYSTKGVFHIIKEATSERSSIVLDGCYLDSAIPLFKDLDMKRFKLHKTNGVEASANANQKTIMATMDYIGTLDTNIVSISGSHIPLYMRNFAMNGDLSCGVKNNNDWLYVSSSMNGHYNIVPNGRNFKVELTFVDNTSRMVLFKSPKLKVTGFYTSYMMIKKTGGEGTLQTDYKVKDSSGTKERFYTRYDLVNVPDGTELVLTGRKPIFAIEGQEIEFGLSVPSGVTINNLKFEVLEVGILAGTMVQLGLPLHPDCDLSGYGTSTERPTNKKVGFTYFDKTLGKLIVWDGSKYVGMDGSVV